MRLFRAIGVSIHAPARGATRKTSSRAIATLFQSTLPHVRNRDRESRARDLKKAAAEAGLTRSQYDRVRDLARQARESASPEGRRTASALARATSVRLAVSKATTSTRPGIGTVIHLMKELADARGVQSLLAAANEQSPQKAARDAAWLAASLEQEAGQSSQIGPLGPPGVPANLFPLPHRPVAGIVSEEWSTEEARDRDRDERVLYLKKIDEDFFEGG